MKNFSNTDYSQESYSSYTEQRYHRQVYWGDTHLHIRLSIDSYSAENVTLGPEDGNRFAKELAATGREGLRAQLHRPLDFLVVADHAGNLGLLAGLQEADPVVLKTAVGKRLFNEKS